MFNSQPHKSSISRRLIKYIILFSSFITLLITIAQLYRDYNADVSLINYELKQIEGIHLQSLTAALWSSNKKLLQTSIEGIKKIRDIEYVEITDADRTWIKTGEKKEGNTISRTYEMNYLHKEKNMHIGVLTVIASLDGVYKRLLDKAWIVLISNGLKTLLVVIFIYFIFHHLIIKHLSKISAFAEDSDFLLKDNLLTLDRDAKKRDELDAVVKAINNMRNRLHEQLIEINKQKQYLSQTLDSIGDAVIVTDRNGNVTKMNSVAEKLTGWTSTEAQKKPLKAVFPIVDASTEKPIKNPVEKVINSGEVVHLSNHTTLISRNGNRYHISDSAAPIRGDDKILGMVLVFNDVTEQYKMLQLVASSEKKYQTLAKVIPVGIFYTDKQGNCLYVNEKWSEITGLSAQTSEKEDWIKHLHKEDRKPVFEQWELLLKEDLPFKMEYRFQQKNIIHWVLGQATPEENEVGEVVGYIGSITDITDRKKAEETIQISAQRLSKAQAIAHVGNWEIDLIENKSTWSDEVYRIFETDINTSGTPNSIFEKKTHPDDLGKVNLALSKAIKNHHSYNIEYRLCMEDYTIKHVHSKCEIIYDNDAQPIFVTGTIQDITERINLEETLQRTQKMNALGKLTGGIAHDYNNMLNIILGYSDLLAKKLKNQPELASYIQKMQHAGERGAKLTNRLLAFTRHKMTDASILNINILLLEEQDMLQRTLTSRINLVFNLEDDLWPVWLDSSDLEDAIVNMCINAMHAIKDQGQLTIQTRNERINVYEANILQLNEGDYVLLSITDTGCGMSDNVKEKIFEPFYTTKEDMGTGLGLSQVYGFIERSNGAIKVCSQVEQGTQFLLYFPKYYGESNIDILEQKKSIEDLSGSESILMVDDEQPLLELGCKVLEKQGYKVFSAQSGKQALKILESKAIDLVLSDIIMTEMSGYQLIKIVKEKYPNIKTQLVSGYSDAQNNDVEDKLLQENILYKPYTSETLLERLRSLLD